MRRTGAPKPLWQQPWPRQTRRVEPRLERRRQRPQHSQLSGAEWRKRNIRQPEGWGGEDERRSSRDVEVGLCLADPQPCESMQSRQPDQAGAPTLRGRRAESRRGPGASAAAGARTEGMTELPGFFPRARRVLFFPGAGAGNVSLETRFVSSASTNPEWLAHGELAIELAHRRWPAPPEQQDARRKWRSLFLSSVRAVAWRCVLLACRWPCRRASAAILWGPDSAGCLPLPPAPSVAGVVARGHRNTTGTQKRGSSRRRQQKGSPRARPHRRSCARKLERLEEESSSLARAGRPGGSVRRLQASGAVGVGRLQRRSERGGVGRGRPT